MDKDELQKLYEDLELEEQRLREQLAVIAQQNPAVKGDLEVKVPDYGDEDDDNTLEEVDLERNFAIATELETKLRQIVETKEKIKNGTYGK